MAETLSHPELLTLKSNKRTTNRILDVQFGNGYRQTIKDGLNSNVDHWFLEYAPVSGTDLIDITTFLNTVGVTEWFNWTPIAEGSIKKFIIEVDSIILHPLDKTRYRITFTISQVFNLGT